MASAQAAWTATTLLHPACHIGPCQENLWLVSTHWCVRAGQEACMQQLQTVPHKPAGIHCWGVGALLIDASCAMPFLAASKYQCAVTGRPYASSQGPRHVGEWKAGGWDSPSLLPPRPHQSAFNNHMHSSHDACVGNKPRVLRGPLSQPWEGGTVEAIVLQRASFPSTKACSSV